MLWVYSQCMVDQDCTLIQIKDDIKAAPWDDINFRFLVL